jgi:HSP20 family protein
VDLCDPDLLMPAWPSVLHAAELGDLTEDVRRLLQELAGSSPRGHAGGDCQPPIDVIETDEAVEILLDLPGVPAESVRVLLKGPVLLIAGEKWVHGPGAGNGGYHLVERASGRFARAVRLSGAFDGARVRATLNEGELRITLPKLADRRGRGLDVPVTPVQGPVRS